MSLLRICNCICKYGYFTIVESTEYCYCGCLNDSLEFSKGSAETELVFAMSRESLCLHYFLLPMALYVGQPVYGWSRKGLCPFVSLGQWVPLALK